ncbi:LysR family transcriptional regulator [Pseudomonas typographi]|uniref:LysR family transcriptional regulator n=1 Tax=Pseudomonas typographi TaxID=2715964 RepID=A0ABR7YYQ3_9PSED|nr:LysR family transcriptional regulator [Pseudomonas typographi]MBD1550866.1 LysR family transcriptional regulator [Pseudomonas typographi]MBD1589147.1 LysR family transcriptional regulator [Pseudomonas typographi]MBD1598331.1 LysR family transcriptional regulator [Pseudomonas typographi]
MLPSTKQLQHFIAIAETGQVSKAALRCHVTQSSMTASLKALERGVGATLFSRHPGGVRLTEAGVRFLRHAQQVQATLREAVASLAERPSPVSGPLRLGVTETISAYVLAPLLGTLTEQFPQLELHVLEQQREQIEQGLQQGELDLAIVLASNLQPGALQTQPLVRSPRQLWGHPEHPLMSADRVSLADVAAQPYILLDMDEHVGTVTKYWAAFGLPVTPHFRSASIEAVRSLVASGHGVTILSDLVYRPWSLDGQRIVRRPLADPVPTMDVGLAWAQARPQGAAFFELKTFLQGWFKAPQRGA